MKSVLDLYHQQYSVSCTVRVYVTLNLLCSIVALYYFCAEHFVVPAGWRKQLKADFTRQSFLLEAIILQHMRQTSEQCQCSVRQLQTVSILIKDIIISIIIKD